MTATREKTFPVGKYLVSPQTLQTESGLYAAAVSIRHGRHNDASKRVFRFAPRFATRLGAQQFAIAEGLSWLHEQRLV